ncbi:MAG: chromosome segregation protein SMC [Ruminococcus sp.]|jgi:chromosome segregation protein|nr:chromosome segregation protein SMC [Ruminococcus sp.]
MYLESIEIQGFKSFPDKLTLSFGKGITAIVGPNGSGKSNIGDAVRWVLGEQSSKTLRGGKMEDVIFAGTQTRRSMGFASVTLNIQNDRGLISAPPGLLSVSRKLYKTGESEYIINGSQARLKDVIELFMDTGLGRDGYAIIGQGKVADIVSNKSGDRREIFEEASGISKLRFKRDNANRDMVRAEESLVRLADIYNEIKSRIEPLREQSEKAAKFIEIEGKRKDLEVSVWVHELDNIKTAIVSLDDEILINRSAYETSNAEKQSLEEENERLYKSSSELLIRIETLRNEIAEREKLASNALSEIAVAENDINHANDRIADTEKEIANSDNTDAGLKKLIEEKFAEIEAVKLEVSETEIITEKLEEALLLTAGDESDEESRELNSRLNAAYIRESEYRFFIENAAGSIETDSRRADEAALQIKTVEEEQKSLEAEKTEIADGKKTAEEAIEGLKNRLAGVTKLFENRSEKAKTAAATLENLRLNERDLTGRIKLLSDLEKNMEGFAHSVKEILKCAENGVIKGIHGTVGGLLAVDAEYTLAIETALGAALQNIIVNNEDTAKRSINHLKQTGGGRATFLPVSTISGRTINEQLDGEYGFCGIASKLISFEPQYAGIYENLLGKTAVFEDLDSATEAAKRHRYSFKIVTLDGQVINAGGSFTGGSSNKKSGILSRKNEIERLTANHREILSDIETAAENSKKLAEDANKLHFDIEGIKEQIQTANTDLIRFESEIKRIESMETKLAADIDNLKKTVAGLKSRIKKTEADKKEVEGKAAALTDEIEALEKSVKDSAEKQAELRLKREAKASEISDNKLKITALSKDIDNITGQINALEDRLRESGGSIVRLNAIISEQREIIRLREEKIAALKGSMTDTDSAIDEIRGKIAALRTSHAENEQLSKANREKENDVIKKREEFGRLLSKAEERKKINEAAFDDLINKMSEEYDIYYSDAKERALPIKDLPAAKRELNKYREQIRAIGVVNLSAIEEFKEVSERYNFLKGQMDDITKSKRELERLIGELTERMKAMFSETFEQINANFKRIFIELFGGGKASLTLTNPEDILESGIEINVAPPGKVIKNLSLLSGGEQAFVAIAIYFSILTVKPSPFCILDEIEAALDDINVSKYARYLRKFTADTQFICITHRRGTMDEADILYGVTMQEKGISRVLKMEN